jgi:hypothetical protein
MDVRQGVVGESGVCHLIVTTAHTQKVARIQWLNEFVPFARGKEQVGFEPVLTVVQVMVAALGLV